MMNSKAVKQVSPEAYFVVDTLGYCNQITQFDVSLATQTISSVVREDTVIELPADQPGEAPEVA